MSLDEVAKFISAVGTPVALLFVVLYAAHRLSKFIAPHIARLVDSHVIIVDAVKSHMQEHTDLLGKVADTSDKQVEIIGQNSVLLNGVAKLVSDNSECLNLIHKQVNVMLEQRQVMSEQGDMMDEQQEQIHPGKKRPKQRSLKMAMKNPKVTFKQGKDKKWYWNVQDTNGEIIGQGEGYATKYGAERGFDNLCGTILQYMGVCLCTRK